MNIRTWTSAIQFLLPALSTNGFFGGFWFRLANEMSAVTLVMMILKHAYLYFSEASGPRVGTLHDGTFRWIVEQRALCQRYVGHHARYYYPAMLVCCDFRLIVSILVRRFTSILLRKIF